MDDKPAGDEPEKPKVTTTFDMEIVETPEPVPFDRISPLLMLSGDEAGEAVCKLMQTFRILSRPYNKEEVRRSIGGVVASLRSATDRLSDLNKRLPDDPVQPEPKE